MEHRQGERLTVNLRATVYTRRGERVSVTIGNLSCSGAFLVVPAERAVLRGLIEVEFCLPDGEWRRWPAFVVRQRPDGAGVMFDDLKQGELAPYLSQARTREPGQPPAGIAA